MEGYTGVVGKEGEEPGSSSESGCKDNFTGDTGIHASSSCTRDKMVKFLYLCVSKGGKGKAVGDHGFDSIRDDTKAVSGGDTGLDQFLEF